MCVSRIGEAMALQKKNAIESIDMTKALLEEVIRSHLTSDPKTLPKIRDSQDTFIHCIVYFIDIGYRLQRK